MKKKLLIVISVIAAIFVLSLGVYVANNSENECKVQKTETTKNNKESKETKTKTLQNDTKVKDTDLNSNDITTAETDDSDVKEIAVVDENDEMALYYANAGKLLSIYDCDVEKNCLTEAEAVDLLKSRGFISCDDDESEDLTYFRAGGITYDYDENGKYIGENVITGDNPNAKHPMYEMFYVSENNNIWNVLIVDKTIYVNPVSFNLEISKHNSQLVLSESEKMICYDSEKNRFFETIPTNRDVIINAVIDKITAEDLSNINIQDLNNY